MSKRRNHEAAFKARGALEALNGERTVSELATAYEAYPTDGNHYERAGEHHEWGCKVSVATTLGEGFVVDVRSFLGAPYDGPTLSRTLEQVTILTDQRPELAVVDRSYRGHGETSTLVLISRMRRGLTPKLTADLRRQSAIEAESGHMKTDGRLSRSPLKGILGDAVFAVLCACGHNIRKILAHLRALFAWIIVAILTAVNVHRRDLQMPRVALKPYSE